MQIDCVLVGLDWVEPMMFFLFFYFFYCMSHVQAFPCIRTLFSIYFDIFELLGTFLSVSLSLSFLFTLVVSMALKRKSASSRNPLHSRASSLSDPTPSSIQFHDKDAQKHLSKKFSR